MSKAARSIQIWSFYVMAVGVAFVFVPGFATGLFGLAEPLDVWVRVAGGLAFGVGVYYLVAANHNLIPLFKMSVYVRLGFCAFFVALVLLNLIALPGIIIGIVDAVGALATRWALQQDGNPA